MDSQIKNIIDKYSQDNDNLGFDDEIYSTLFSELKSIMSKYVGIERNQEGLKTALETIESIELRLGEVEISYSRVYFELKNALCVAKLIAKAALLRENSIGAHFRADDINNHINNNIYKGQKDDSLLAK